MHIAVDAKFAKSGEPVRQVYLSLKKKGNEKGDNNLYQNVYGDYNKEKGQFEITLDVSANIEHFNGEYDFEIHVADNRASGK